MFQLALLLHNFDKTLWPKCHIQWLYLAAHGCKTYLNLNLYSRHPTQVPAKRWAPATGTVAKLVLVADSVGVGPSHGTAVRRWPSGDYGGL
jgi:hypothetical protein